MNHRHNQPMPLTVITTPQPEMMRVENLEPPVRVQVAVAVLRELTGKTRSTCAINDLSIEIIDGQKLTHAEANLQASAANFLTDYLKGKDGCDKWEKEKVRVTYEMNESCHGTILNCFSCASLPQPLSTCKFCKGTGTVLVSPVVGN